MFPIKLSSKPEGITLNNNLLLRSTATILKLSLNKFEMLSSLFFLNSINYLNCFENIISVIFFYFITITYHQFHCD